MISKKQRISLKGFTLLETLVAILILTMAVAAPIYVAGKSLHAALIAKDEITAYYLAQDAMEYIRFVRDSNTLGGNPWLTGLGACTSANGNTTCTVDSFNNSVAACSGVCPPLNYDAKDNGGYYTYGAGSPSMFTRTVSIVSPVSTIPTSDEGFVTVVVTWKDEGGLSHTVQIEEDMLNWQ